MFSYPELDSVGECAFSKEVPSFSSTKSGRYSPLEKKKGLFSWSISPLFAFANTIELTLNTNLKLIVFTTSILVSNLSEPAQFLLSRLWLTRILG